MYSIKADGADLYIYGAQDGFTVLNPMLELELNTAGTLTFTVLPENNMYNDLNKLKTVIEVMRDGKPFWRGRVISSQRDFYNRKEIICEGELAFLNDYQQRPFEFRGTIKQYLEMLLSGYNAAVDDWKRFEVGNVTVIDNNDFIYRYKESYNSTLDCLKEQLLDTHGGYLVTREENGKHYLDYLVEPGQYSKQSIVFGRNMLNLDEFINADDVYTVIIPRGAMIDVPDPDAPPPESEDEEPATKQVQVDITSVNGGNDYIVSNDGVELFGHIEKVVEWDDVTEPQNLYNKALEALESAIDAAVTIQIDAVDLSYINKHWSSIDLGDTVRCVSMAHSLDGAFMLSALKVNLDTAGGESYTFGATRSTITGIINHVNKISGGSTDSITVVNIEDVQTHRKSKSVVGNAIVGDAIAI